MTVHSKPKSQSHCAYDCFRSPDDCLNINFGIIECELRKQKHVGKFCILSINLHV